MAGFDPSIEGVEPGAPVLLRRAPLRPDEAALLQPHQAGIERAHVEDECAVGNLLEPGGDRVAVRRAERDQRPQHHQVERAAQDFRPLRVSIRHSNKAYRKPYWDVKWNLRKVSSCVLAEQRLAHHEPVFARPLREDHDRILEVTGAGSLLTCGRGSSSSSRGPRLLDAADGVTGTDFWPVGRAGIGCSVKLAHALAFPQCRTRTRSLLRQDCGSSWRGRSLADES